MFAWYGCRFVTAEENNGVMSTIPNKPVELKNFVKHCEQRRKFPVLYKVEFQVRKFSRTTGTDSFKIKSTPWYTT